MADKSRIEWTDATWPIVQGCDYQSPGCTNCYAVRDLWRMQHHPNPTISAPIAGLVEKRGDNLVWTGNVALREDRLDWPLKWREPRMIFLSSHGDLFHPDVPNEFIDRVFAVMALAPQHTFQVLTKRPERMAEYFAERWQGTPAQRIEFSDGAQIDVDAGGETGRRHEVEGALSNIVDEYDGGRLADTDNDALWDESGSLKARHFGWPLPNVILGSSVEDQRRADERREPMRRLAEAGWKTIVSYEPALGPVDWQGWDFLAGLISGGESGPAARQSHPDWYRSARDFSLPRGIAYFHKQNGEWIDADEWFDQLESIPMVIRADGLPFPWMPKRPLNFDDAAKLAERTGRKGQFEHQSDGTTLIRVGKKAAGRLLDGVTHNGMPA